MAFREKVLWASMLLTLAIWGRYFWRFVVSLKAGNYDQDAALGSFIATVVLIVTVHIAAAILVAIVKGEGAEEPADDREKAFALSAYRPAFYVLAIGVGTLMLGSQNLLRAVLERTPPPPPGLEQALLGNALLLLLVLADLVYYGAQIVRFRRGG